MFIAPTGMDYLGVSQDVLKQSLKDVFKGVILDCQSIETAFGKVLESGLGNVELFFSSLSTYQSEIVDASNNTLCHAVVLYPRNFETHVDLLVANGFDCQSLNRSGEDPLTLLLQRGDYSKTFYFIKKTGAKGVGRYLTDYFQLIMRRIDPLHFSENDFSLFFYRFFNPCHLNNETLQFFAKIFLQEIIKGDLDEKQNLVLEMLYLNSIPFRSCLADQIKVQESTFIGDDSIQKLKRFKEKLNQKQGKILQEMISCANPLLSNPAFPDSNLAITLPIRVLNPNELFITQQIVSPIIEQIVCGGHVGQLSAIVRAIRKANSNWNILGKSLYEKIEEKISQRQNVGTQEAELACHRLDHFKAVYDPLRRVLEIGDHVEAQRVILTKPFLEEDFCTYFQCILNFKYHYFSEEEFTNLCNFMSAFFKKFRPEEKEIEECAACLGRKVLDGDNLIKLGKIAEAAYQGEWSFQRYLDGYIQGLINACQEGEKKQRLQGFQDIREKTISNKKFHPLSLIDDSSFSSSSQQRFLEYIRAIVQNKQFALKERKDVLLEVICYLFKLFSNSSAMKEDILRKAMNFILEEMLSESPLESVPIIIETIYRISPLSRKLLGDLVNEKIQSQEETLPNTTQQRYVKLQSLKLLMLQWI